MILYARIIVLVYNITGSMIIDIISYDIKDMISGSMIIIDKILRECPSKP